MILRIENISGDWIARVYDDEGNSLGIFGRSKRLGCAMRDAVNMLTARYGAAGFSVLTIDLSEW